MRFVWVHVRFLICPDIKFVKVGLMDLSTYWNSFLRFARTRRSLTTGLIIVISFSIIALFAPFLSPYDPFESYGKINVPPSFPHVMGTDHIGRDVLSRIIWGTRVSLMMGAVAASISFFIGGFLGILTGYYDGVFDDLVSRITEMFIAIPRILLLIVAVGLLGANIWITALLVGITMWPTNTRIMRSQAFSLKERPFVKALRVFGASNFRIIFKHILPNGMYPLITNTVLQVASAITIEAGLSFLGLGDLNFSSWGQVIYSIRYANQNWWVVLFPGACIVILITGLSLIARTMITAEV